MSIKTYPKLLFPSSIETIALKGEIINIPKCIIELEKWDGKQIVNTFGNKPIVKFNNKPMFAELAIMNHFIKNGWEARWIETYGAIKKPKILSSWKDDKYQNQIEDPILNTDIINMLEGIAKYNNSFSGCWDVVVWKNKDIIFAELKHHKKDKIRKTQINWLLSCLENGLKVNNFLVVEWNFKV